MAITIMNMSIAISTFGILSFVLGIIAENEKPSSGTPIIGKGGVIICNYPSDPTVILGFISILCLAASAALGFYSIFYPYKEKHVPRVALFQTTTLVVFFQIALWLSLLSGGMLLWASITEQLHLTRNVHRNVNAGCPTAKTGLFGGAAFLALDASLFWLVCLMLADNAREDHFGGGEEEEEEMKGDYGQVLGTEYDVNGPGRVVNGGQGYV